MSVTRTVRLIALATLIASPATFAAEAKGNAENGKALFTSKACVTCHAIAATEAGKLGPNLAGVVGRKAGATQGLMPTSEAMKKYGVTWNDKTLDEFLTNPAAKVPGTAMVGTLPDAKDRADVIAYLKTLKK